MPSSAGVRLDMLLLGAEVVPEDVAPLFTIRPQPLLNVVIEFSVLLTIQIVIKRNTGRIARQKERVMRVFFVSLLLLNSVSREGY